MREPRLSVRLRFFIALLLCAAVILAPSAARALSIGGVLTGGTGAFFWEKAVRPGAQFGGGLVLDSLESNNDMINYRFTLGCGNFWNSIDRVRSFPLFANFPQGSYPLNYRVHSLRWGESFTISVINTLCFGVVRRDHFRFWLAPELIISTAHRGARHLFLLLFGGGPAAGFDIMLRQIVITVSGSLRVDGAYRYSEYRFFHYQWVDELTTSPQWSTGVKHEMGYRVSGHLQFGVMMRVPKDFGSFQ